MLFSYPRPICQEEEDEHFQLPGGGSSFRPRKARLGAELTSEESPEAETLTISPELWRDLVAERTAILKDEKLSTRDKVRLLETGRYPLAVASGRGVTFKTEQVVRWMLLYSMAVVIILAVLTSLDKLPKEVTISFVGTVVGGLIATVAQKLGKL